MFTWDERRRLRALQAELKRLREVYEPDIRKLESEEKGAQGLIAEYLNERDLVEGPIKAIETSELKRRAERWAVPVPRYSDETRWSRDYAGNYFLSAEAYNDVKRVVREEFRKEVNFWNGILIPILSLIIALAAILAGDWPFYEESATSARRRSSKPWQNSRDLLESRCGEDGGMGRVLSPYSPGRCAVGRRKKPQDF